MATHRPFNKFSVGVRGYRYINFVKLAIHFGYISFSSNLVIFKHLGNCRYTATKMNF